MSDPTAFDTIDLADGLAVDIHLHGFYLGDRDRSCWTYLTRGLVRHGQREMSLSVLIEDDDATGTFPKTPVRMFQLLAEKTRGDRQVDYGDATRLGQKGIFGFPCLFFAPAIQFPDLPSLDDYLGLILVHEVEYEYARRYGFTRFLSRLGRYCSSFPYPTWNTPLRPAIFTGDTREVSLLADASHVSIEHSCVHQADKVVQFQLHHADADATLGALRTLNPGQMAVFNTAFSPRCDATLYWQEGQADPGAFSAPNHDGGIIGGSFLTIGCSDVPEISIVEDGFSVTLLDDDWQTLLTAVADNQAFECSMTDGDRFVLDYLDASARPQARRFDPVAVWRKLGADTSKLGLEKSATPFIPEGAVDPRIVHAGTCIHLSNEGTAAAGVDGDELNDYVNSIERALDKAMADETASFQFDLELTITPDGVEPRLVTDQALNPDFISFVESAVTAMPTCPVETTIHIRVPFTVNGQGGLSRTIPQV